MDIQVVDSWDILGYNPGTEADVPGVEVGSGDVSLELGRRLYFPIL